MFDIKHFGAYLSERRKKLNLTQSEVADRLNVTRQAVSRYECGDSFPEITILVAMAQLYGASLDELVGSGRPTAKEAALLLSSGAESETGIHIGEILNVAPFVKPSLLDEWADSLAEHLTAGEGLDLKGLAVLSEFVSSRRMGRLIEKAMIVSDDYELIARLMPFLDEEAKLVLLKRIVEGELDCRFIEILLPYAPHLVPQLEAAVVDGALDEKTLKMIENYIWRDK